MTIMSVVILSSCLLLGAAVASKGSAADERTAVYFGDGCFCTNRCFVCALYSGVHDLHSILLARVKSISLKKMFATINHLFDFAGERQYAYVNIEYGLFNRSMADVTSHVGYAGSTKIG